MKNILTLLLVLLCGAMNAQDQTEKGDHNNDGHPDNGKSENLPNDAKTLTDKYNADVAQLTSELVKSLGKCQSDETKKGNLENALAVRALIDQYTGKTVAAPVAKPLAQAAPVAKPKVAALNLSKQAIVGVYQIKTDGGWNGAFSLKANGEAAQHGLKGTYKFADNKVTISWDNNTVEWWVMTSETEGSGADKDGIAFTAKRLPDAVDPTK